MKTTKSSWELGRFLQTLTYFEVIPVLNWVQRQFHRSTLTQPMAIPASTAKTVLVVGATGGVGQRVVKQLRDRGYSVRALVRDLARGKTVLADDVEIIDADITLADTLTPAVVKDIGAVICCIGPRVQPKEGDTVDRAKYYQGIQFYLPEIVGDTP